MDEVPQKSPNTHDAQKASVAGDCKSTRGELYRLLKEYNDALPDSGEPTPKLTLIFNQTFVAGSAGDPRCKRCDRFIAEHIESPMKPVNEGAAKRAREPVSTDALLQNVVGRVASQHSDATKFDDAHLLSQRADAPGAAWKDWRFAMEFRGRGAFAAIMKRNVAAIEARAPASTKEATAYVYSSVSGTGKTISLLELKKSLTCATVAYLGFNTNLMLGDAEKAHIANWGELGASEVLARRLTAATVISKRNPDAVTVLPHYDDVYKGFRIPSVDKSMTQLLRLTGATTSSPLVIVAGVDEVQLLNQSVTVGDQVGLGRVFLRQLRQWQYDWYKHGLRIVPLGTGIAIDWAVDPTEGMNVPLCHNDTVLVGKEDFREVVKSVVGGLSNSEFVTRFGPDTSRNTISELMSAMYWPRVRLLQWWRDNATLPPRDVDEAGSHWPRWLQFWMRDEKLKVDVDPVPGNGGRIFTLFQLSSGGNELEVIPDGYTSSSIVRALREHLPVPGLYEGLDCIKSLDPKDLLPCDAYEFEDRGFHVLGASVYIGLHALSKITLIEPTAVQQQRLGLAMWLRSKGVRASEKVEKAPMVILGPTISTAIVGDYYPFEDQKQKRFGGKVQKLVLEALNDNRHVFLRCGRLTCCDYIFLFRPGDGESNDLVGIIGDAKLTRQVAGSGETVPGDEQVKMFRSFVAVHSAVQQLSLYKLVDVRLVFLTNRNRLADSVSGELKEQSAAAKQLLPHAKLELLNVNTFDFGPFSDFLFARLQR